MLDIQKQFINYNRSARTGNIKYIVIHSTGNTNDTAQNNHDYFASCNRNASADYFIDDNNVIQIIDSDKYYSWHCGDGHGAYGISNSNSIGIEMCGTDNGNISETTINNTIDLVKYLMNKYEIDLDHVVRHYDASRKCCPSQFSNNNWSRWYDFKEQLKDNRKGYVITTYLPHAYNGYNGVDINYVLKYFKGVKTYVKGDKNGIWIETQMLPLSKCEELKKTLGSWFYSIEK